MNPNTEDEDKFDRPSKTQRKQAMAELQALGEDLITLPSERLKKVDLPDELRTAVLEGEFWEGTQSTYTLVLTAYGTVVPIQAPTS